MLTKHFKPAPSEIFERFKFHSRSRKPCESVATFIAELRSLAEFCNFGDTLEPMLSDRIVCGINDDVLQRRLLAESGLDYGKAVEIALNLETAAQCMKEMKSKPDDQASRVTHSPPQYQVHKTGVASPPQHQVHRASTTSTSNRGSQGKSEPTCYRCGVRGHVVSKCKVDKEVVCHQCGRKGHLRCACRGSRKASEPTSPRGTNQGNRTVYQVGEEEDGSDSAGSPLYHVRSSAVHPSPPIKVQVKLDECLVGMEATLGQLCPLCPKPPSGNYGPTGSYSLHRSASKPMQRYNTHTSNWVLYCKRWL